MKPRQLEEVQFAPKGSLLSRHSANQKPLKLHQQVSLAKLHNQILSSLQNLTSCMDYFTVESGKTINVFSAITRIFNGTDGLCGSLLVVALPLQRRRGQRVGSCGWQEAEMVVATMGCQDSVSLSNSSSAQTGHSLFTVTSEKAGNGSRQHGEWRRRGTAPWVRLHRVLR